MIERRPLHKKLASRAGLWYVSDEEAGIVRQRRGQGFSYRYSSGRLVRDQRHLARIESLAIPPAWINVWICRDELGHLQATGRDDSGRKQFLYHPTWQEAANRAKFEHLAELSDALPRIRRRVAAQLRRRKPSREKTLALIVRLLDLTGMRVGHEEYVQENGAYGLTTLRRKHLHLKRTSAEFRFPGKSRQQQVVVIEETGTLVALQSCLMDNCQSLFAYRGKRIACRASTRQK
jgi:DNA topoisomerase-1